MKAVLARVFALLASAPAMLCAQAPPTVSPSLLIERWTAHSGDPLKVMDYKVPRHGQTSGASFKKGAAHGNSHFFGGARSFLGNGEGLWMTQAFAEAKTFMDLPQEDWPTKPHSATYHARAQADVRDFIQINLAPGLPSMTNMVIEMEFELLVFEGPQEQSHPNSNATTGAEIGIHLHGSSSVMESDPELFASGKRSRHVVSITRTLMPLPPKGHPNHASQGLLTFTAGISASVSVPAYYSTKAKSRPAIQPGVSGLIMTDLRVLDSEGNPM